MGTANTLIDQIMKTHKRTHVLLRAPVFTCSGYGIHARQVAAWLLEAEKAGKITLTIQPVNWGNTPWYLNGEMLGGLVGEMQQHCAAVTAKPDVSIQLQLPNEWDPNTAVVNIGMTAGVESDKCNPAWIDACNRMSRVVVPSNHVLSTLKASGNITVPVDVVPESFPREFLSYPLAVTAATEKLDSLPTKFNFLVFGQLTGDAKNDRKNTHTTLRWLSEAFADDNDVGIILKTNSSRNTKIDRNLTESIVSRAIASFRKPNHPPVYLFHGDMSAHELKSIYCHTNTRAIVSLTRGEGWGLPLLEAATCDLPVIATDWSGHLDFLSQGKFLKINYDLKNIPPARVDGQIWMQGTRWAEPRENDFKQKVAKFRVTPDVPKQWAKDLGVVVREKFSPLAVFTAYDRVLGQYLMSK